MLALLRFVGTRPSRYVVTTGDTRSFPSVSCVVWESACSSSLIDGYANVSAFARAEVTWDLVAVRQYLFFSVFVFFTVLVYWYDSVFRVMFGSTVDTVPMSVYGGFCS